MADTKRLADLEADMKAMRETSHVKQTLTEARQKLYAAFDEYEGEILHGLVNEHHNLSVADTIRDFVSNIYHEAWEITSR